MHQLPLDCTIRTNLGTIRILALVLFLFQSNQSLPSLLSLQLPDSNTSCLSTWRFSSIPVLSIIHFLSFVFLSFIYYFCFILFSCYKKDPLCFVDYYFNPLGVMVRVGWTLSWGRHFVGVGH